MAELLTAEQILGHQPESAEVQCPGMGGTLRIRRMTAMDRAKFDDFISQFGDKDFSSVDGVRQLASIVVFAAVDAEGRRLFADDQVDEVADHFEWADLMGVKEAFGRLNYIGAEADADAKKKSKASSGTTSE